MGCHSNSHRCGCGCCSHDKERTTVIYCNVPSYGTRACYAPFYTPMQTCCAPMTSCCPTSCSSCYGPAKAKGYTQVQQCCGQAKIC